MKKVVIQICAAGILICRNAIGQQDIHHTQYLNTPVAVNAASTGMFNGAFRFLGNYRSQWNAFGKPFTSMYFSADGSFLKGKISNGFFGAGAQFYTDEAGDSKFKTTGAMLSASYHFDLTGDQERSYLSIGIQGGTVQRSVSFLNLTWDVQWNGNNFDQSINSKESLPVASQNFFDLNTGLQWYFQTDDELKQFVLGTSFYHLNAADITFRSLSERIDRRFHIHGNAEIGFSNSNVAVLPSFIYMRQGPNYYFNIGTELKIKLQERTKITNYRNEMSLSFGPYYRNGDALLAMLRINWAGIMLGVSYDYNISPLKMATRGYGAMEFTLGFRTDFGANKRPHKVRFI